jgi:hypothetical protein
MTTFALWVGSEASRRLHKVVVDMSLPGMQWFTVTSYAESVRTWQTVDFDLNDLTLSAGVALALIIENVHNQPIALLRAVRVACCIKLLLLYIWEHQRFQFDPSEC